MKLRQVRGQPLLEPPRESSWWSVTAKDVEIISAAMEHFRFEKKGRSLARLHLAMKGLRVPAEISAEDDRLMLGPLKGGKEGIADGYALANTLYALKALGRPQNFNSHDEERMVGDLYSSGGASLPQMEYWLKELGVRTGGVSRPNLNLVGDDILRQERRDGMGAEVAIILFHMDKLGIPLKPTQADRELMRRTIEKLRRKNDGLVLAEMLQYVSNIIPPSDVAAGGLNMPPLKRF